jgi:hypothetical protein
MDLGEALRIERGRELGDRGADQVLAAADDMHDGVLVVGLEEEHVVNVDLVHKVPGTGTDAPQPRLVADDAASPPRASRSSSVARRASSTGGVARSACKRATVVARRVAETGFSR